MGWDFTRGTSKKDIVDSLTRSWKTDNMEAKTLKFKVIKNTLWQVVEYKEKERTRLLIVCCLLKNKRHFGWGYKSMLEVAHPFYYDCPLEFFDLAPVQCQEWRDKCKDYQKV